MADVKRKILVVDDDPEVASVIKEMIEFLGYSTLAAYDGLEGIRVTEEYNPDAVFTDVFMPQLDGIGMLKQLRERDYKGPTCLMSGYIHQDKFGRHHLLPPLPDKLSEYGIDETSRPMYFTAILKKPCSTEDIERILNDFFPERSP